MIWTLVQIGIGGALGAMGRFLTGVAAERLLGAGFPSGTLAVNVAGSLLMGIGFVMLVERPSGNPALAPLILTGFLGGYTTFSAYSLDVWRLVSEGRVEAALAYALGSALIAVAALAVGILLARWVVA